MKLRWIGTVAFQVITDEGEGKVFDLAEEQSVPAEFKEGDEIEIETRPDHLASIEMGLNSGYYDVTHLLSGTKLRIKHKTSEWRFRP